MTLGKSLSNCFKLSSRMIQGGLSVVLCCAFISSTTGQQTQGPLTNEAIVKLVKAGFKEKTIIAIVHNRANQFKLGTEELIELKRQGVSENVILAMLSQDESFDFGPDDWSGGSVFKGTGRTADDSSAIQDPGTSIFGTGGSSRSQSRSRSGSGAIDNEGNVTGSATVRILRPPTEGGGVPKLEKTPTLDNDAVARLVEAGFSEGTIIKRIEQSPSDFDLSPSRIEELRRRRVTEPIISAMIAAMGSDAKPTRKSDQ